MNIEVDRLSPSNAHLNEFLFSDVIGRSEVQLLTDDDLKSTFEKSRVLIIGAGGSIGSALATRLVTAGLEQIFFLDRDESALHGLALELSNTAASHSNKCFIADIRDKQSINDVLEIVKPSIVIHAAALKHLVMLERFPREGYLTNITGTLNVAEACLKHGVEQFVNISTDKAANPISVLGKTKKIAELLTEEVFANSDSKQCSVRFGNVFASRGSVIETFIHQISHGLPVTITDQNVARYFMSRNEAANLVLAAASLKVSGTYIQNMGEEVAIFDVVNKIAQYLSLVPTIKFIGLQNGEKLHEELYDGPTAPTKYGSISRSSHKIISGLVKEIKISNPVSNSDAIEQIDQLIKKYLQKS
jgi:FlaA1/EpsC-like NDP-sugar epimerase